MNVVAALRDLSSYGGGRSQGVLDFLGPPLEISPVAVQLSLRQKAINLIGSIAGRRSLWVERSKKNSYFFRAMSTALAQSIQRATRGNYDVILMFEALYSPGLGSGRLEPYVIYEDCTSRVAAQRWPSWVPDTARTVAYQRLEADCYRGAARVLTTNRMAQVSLVRDYGVPEEKVQFVGQGYDLAGVGHGGPHVPDGHILFVGYEFDRKGGWTLLDAFQRVRSRVPRAQLLIVGPEITAAYPGVTVLGPVHDKDRLQRLYREAAVFALPSHFDPMPFAAFDAMAMGIPTVVADGCGTAEIITDGKDGFVVPTGDAEALAQRLAALLRQPDLRERIGRAGAETARLHLQWTAVAARIRAILEDVVRESASSQRGA
jgi:alpha-maltose-1-phosphate synthase